MSVKYDREEVIKKATDLFWEKGFHATSMRNLQEVIDMRPGSIYASFGSKDGLFRETLNFYADAGLKQLAELVETSVSPLEALKSFLRNSVNASCSAPSNMCMLVKSISELTEEDNAELLAESKRLLHLLELAFDDVLIKAKACGELDETTDPKRLGRFLQMQLMGLRSYARATEGHAQVEELLEDVLGSLH